MAPYQIRVTRDVFAAEWTLSRVDIDAGDGRGWLPFGFAVEDADRHVEDDPARKERGRTAIPTGTYRVRLYDSPKHGPNTPELINVPWFNHIQIHSGFNADDSAGCVLMGLTRDIKAGTVSKSRAACSWLRDRIIERIRGGGLVTVEVTRE